MVNDPVKDGEGSPYYRRIRVRARDGDNRSTVHHPSPSRDYADFGVLFGDCRAVEMTEAGTRIKTIRGVRQSFRRKLMPWSVPVWTLATDVKPAITAVPCAPTRESGMVYN